MKHVIYSVATAVSLLAFMMLVHTSDVAADVSSVQDKSVAEGNSGSVPVQIQVNGPFAAGERFEYRTKNGTAIAGEDYQAVDGLAVCPSFGDPCATRFFDVYINGDTDIEDDEYFTIEIYSGSTVLATGRVTILNDDVPDTTPPTLSLPGDLTVEATGPAGATVNFTATATDNNPASPAVTCDPAAGSAFPFGTTTVTCSATDAAGNTATGSFDITVQDTTGPALNLPADITVEAVGPAGNAVTYNATATDAVDGSVATVCNPVSGSTFPLGTTAVNCTSSDTRGNTSNGSFNVTVEDTTPPVLTVPADFVAEATGPAGAAVTFTATAVDIVDSNPSIVCDPVSGSTFAFGTTTVTCTATDTAGNFTTSSFDITVVDTTAPVLTLPDEIATEATGPAGATVNFSVVAFDIADINPDIVCQPVSGSVFAIGQTSVTCTATDDAGNQVSDSFVIKVNGSVDQLVDMADAVNASKLSYSAKYSLNFKLGMAEITIAMGQPQSACAWLDSFSSQVQSLKGKGLTAAEATSLLDSANRVKAVAGCASSPAAPQGRR